MRSFLSLALAALALPLLSSSARADEPPKETGRSGVSVSADSADRGLIGVRGSIARAQLGGENHDSTGLVFAGYGDGFRGDGLLSARASHFFAIGGGTGGFEGGLGGMFAIGLRAPLTGTSGVFVRGAFRGELLGNSEFYFSRLELPEGQIGFQVLARSVQLEVGATIAPVLAGRLRVGSGDSRDLGGSMAAGAFATIQSAHLQLTADVVRIDARGDPGPVKMAQGLLCARTFPIALCADARAIGDTYSGPTDQRVFYGGITLGLTSP
jgi:hypothetical protein